MEVSVMIESSFHWQEKHFAENKSRDFSASNMRKKLVAAYAAWALAVLDEQAESDQGPDCQN